MFGQTQQRVRPPECVWPENVEISDKTDGTYQLAPKMERPFGVINHKTIIAAIDAANKETDLYNSVAIKNYKKIHQEDEKIIEDYNKNKNKLKLNCSDLIDQWLKE